MTQAHRRARRLMIGLDANVLVRYIMQDDPVQSPKATVLIQSLTSAAPGFIPIVTLVEVGWVLMGPISKRKLMSLQCSIRYCAHRNCLLGMRHWSFKRFTHTQTETLISQTASSNVQRMRLAVHTLPHSIAKLRPQPACAFCLIKETRWCKDEMRIGQRRI